MLSEVERAGWALIGLAWAGLGVALLPLVPSGCRVRVRIRRGRPRPSRSRTTLGRALSVLGFALALSGSPAHAQGRPPVPPSRVSADAPTPPWTATGGSPPPRPPVPFEALQVRVGSEEGREVLMERLAEAGSSPLEGRGAVEEGSVELEPPSDPRSATAHPAIHGRPGPVSPLFPRSGNRSPRAPFAERLERAAAMQRHPAGKGLEARVRNDPQLRAADGERREVPNTAGGRAKVPGSHANLATWTVRPSDTLWDIASEVLGTDDLVRIARYWPRIHRANPHIKDPHLIQPGEVLRLPEESRVG